MPSRSEKDAGRTPERGFTCCTAAVESIFLITHLAMACSHLFVFSGSCPATIFVGLAWSLNRRKKGQGVATGEVDRVRIWEAGLSSARNCDMRIAKLTFISSPHVRAVALITFVRKCSFPCCVGEERRCKV